MGIDRLSITVCGFVLSPLVDATVVDFALFLAFTVKTSLVAQVPVRTVASAPRILACGLSLLC